MNDALFAKMSNDRVVCHLFEAEGFFEGCATHLDAAHDVQVQVRNGGGGIFAGVDVHAIARIVHALDLGDLGHHGKQVAEQLWIGVVVEVFVVLLGARRACGPGASGSMSSKA